MNADDALLWEMFLRAMANRPECLPPDQQHLAGTNAGATLWLGEHHAP